MTNVIVAFIQSIYVLLSGILLALLDIVKAVVNVFTQSILASYHIVQGIVGFLYTNLFLLVALGGGYYVYITYINPGGATVPSTKKPSTSATSRAPDSDRKVPSD